jgi:hypothetical protein
MVKVTHFDKLEIVRLYTSGLKNNQIQRNLESKGVSLSRQNINYWIRQYLNGSFNPGEIESKVILSDFRVKKCS